MLYRNIPVANTTCHWHGHISALRTLLYPTEDRSIYHISLMRQVLLECSSRGQPPYHDHTTSYDVIKHTRFPTQPLLFPSPVPRELLFRWG